MPVSTKIVGAIPPLVFHQYWHERRHHDAAHAMAGHANVSRTAARID
jgi:hypothetical protein